jgi:hypothetical protein
VDPRFLDAVRRKFVALMRTDPPPRVFGVPREPLAPVFDTWVAKHFSADEVSALFELEVEQGERAVVEWFAAVLKESGFVTRRLRG